MVMPVNQRCPKCGEWFMGSDAIGDLCMNCKLENQGIEMEICPLCQGNKKIVKELATLFKSMWKKPPQPVSKKEPIFINTLDSNMGSRSPAFKSDGNAKYCKVVIVFKDGTEEEIFRGPQYNVDAYQEKKKFQEGNL